MCLSSDLGLFVFASDRVDDRSRERWFGRVYDRESGRERRACSLEGKGGLHPCVHQSFNKLGPPSQQSGAGSAPVCVCVCLDFMHPLQFGSLVGRQAEF